MSSKSKYLYLRRQCYGIWIPTPLSIQPQIPKKYSVLFLKERLIKYMQASDQEGGKKKKEQNLLMTD